MRLERASFAAAPGVVLSSPNSVTMIRAFVSLLLSSTMFHVFGQGPQWTLTEVTCHEVGAVLAFEGEVQSN